MIEIENTLSEHLESFCHDLGASVYTTYLLNPISQNLWLHFKSKQLKYPYHLHGFLSPESELSINRLLDTKRRNAAQISVGGEGWSITTVQFPDIPKSLQSNTHRKLRFSEREGVQSLLITEAVCASPNKSELYKRRQILILIGFKEKFPRTNTIKSICLNNYRCIIPIASIFSEIPVITNQKAWELRSTQETINKSLLSINFSQKDEARSEEVKKFYETVCELVSGLISRTPNSNIATEIYLFKNVYHRESNHLKNTDEKDLQLIASYPLDQAPNDKKDGSKTIVDYVAINQRMFYIEKVSEYLEILKNSSDNTYLPKFINAKQKPSKSELAIPLLLGKSSIGTINIESSIEKAFDKELIILLHKLATFLASSIAFISLQDNFQNAVKQEGVLYQQKNIDDAYKKLIDYVNESGFEGDIWHIDRGWHGSQKRAFFVKPRKDGYTAWVAKHRKIISLEPYLNSEGKVICNIEQASPDSLKWTELDSKLKEDLPHGFNENLKDELRAMISDGRGYILFPLIQGSDEINVRGVLWVKSLRPFQSVLSNEVWTISFLAQTCKNLDGVFSKQEFKTKNQTDFDILKFHFGESRARIIREAEEINQLKLFTPQEHHDILVMSLDLRNSTYFANLVGNPTAYSTFLSKMHAACREAIIDNKGIFDKTVGDGIVSTFNTFQPSIVYKDHDEIHEPQKGQDIFDMGENELQSLENALKAIKQIADTFQSNFASLLQRGGLLKKSDYGFVDMGIGLCFGSGIVGSFYSELDEKGSMQGFDYTVNGSVSNRAGHLVDLAKKGTILNDILAISKDRCEAGLPPQIVRLTENDKPNSPLSTAEIDSLIREIKDQRNMALVFLSDIPNDIDLVAMAKRIKVSIDYYEISSISGSKESSYRNVVWAHFPVPSRNQG